MVLTRSNDIHKGVWLRARDVSWQQVSGYGPPGFEAYARLRFLPDPEYQGQPSSVHSRPDGGLAWEATQLQAAVAALRQYSSTPDRAFYCLWEGWGIAPDDFLRISGSTSAASPDVVEESMDRAAWVTVGDRRCHLFEGSLDDFIWWGAREETPSEDGPEVKFAFTWPADRAWCVAADVDLHWAGMGGSAHAIEALIGTPGLDVVEADPASPVLWYD